MDDYQQEVAHEGHSQTLRLFHTAQVPNAAAVSMCTVSVTDPGHLVARVLAVLEVCNSKGWEQRSLWPNPPGRCPQGRARSQHAQRHIQQRPHEGLQQEIHFVVSVTGSQSFIRNSGNIKALKTEHAV